ncbi:MAG: transposase [Acidobacteria bacterium]|nr:transposase [Acidobacteriota bacterium]
MQRTVISYSEAFKLKVVTELENGKLVSIKQAKQKYGIRGNQTIQNWLKKYGREHLLPRKVRIEVPDEQNQIKKLKKEIRNLKLALADAKVGEVLNRAFFEIACEEFGIYDIETYKKNSTPGCPSSP